MKRLRTKQPVVSEQRIDRKYWFILLCIIVLAAGLRLFRLGNVPLSLYWEEAAIGYDAYSIAQTGKDYHGNPYPLLAFPSFGDYKPSLYFYTVVPFTWLLGRSEVAVRLPSALAGIMTVFAVAEIGRLLWRGKYGLIAALLLAIQPWSIQVSRVGFETNLATMLLSFGVLCVLYSKTKMRWLLVSTALFGLSMYAYHSARIVAPLLGLVTVLVVLGPQTIRKNILLCVSSLFIGLLFLAPILVNLKNPVISMRAAETSIFSDPSVVEESNVLREQQSFSPISRVLYHRYTLFGQKILKQYLDNFSFSFLFVDGDENIRHGTQEFGLLYHWEAVTVLVGVYSLIKKKKKEFWVIVAWTMIAGIPVALTTLSPHTLRFLSAAPAFALLSGLGLIEIVEYIRGNKIVSNLTLLGVILSFTFSFAAYLHYYFRHYPIASSVDWQYGYKQLVTTLETDYKNRDRIYVTREQGRPSIYFLFYGSEDVNAVQDQDKTVAKDQQELLRVGRYMFGDFIPTEKGLLVASSPANKPDAAVERFSVSLPDGKQIWSVWERL